MRFRTNATQMTASKLFIMLVSLVLTQALAGQWNYSPTQNSIVDTGIGKRSTNPGMISDGNGGYFITWMKSRPAVYGTEIFAQRISVNGTRLWSDTGKLICNAAFNQYWPKIVSDGAGGVIITWQDERAAFTTWDIYAQRVSGSGTILWANNGVPVFNLLTTDENMPEMISDNNGGAIITCRRAGFSPDIYAQRIDASGTKLWGTNGTVICSAAFEQTVPKITTDGAGGAIICWLDFRGNMPTAVSDLYAQRVNSSGTVMWANNGVPICVLPYDQASQQITSDNNGGAYITWEDFRTSSPTQPVIDIYAQHINSSGTPLWTVNGIPVCAAANNQQAPNIITDENNGAIISWHDSRTTLSSIYAQKVTAAGIMVWAVNGISVCANANNYIAAPLLASDGNNGAFICWEDKRTGTDRNVFAQHINSIGSPLWATNGIAICNAPNDQLLNILNGQVTNGAIVRSATGTAVIVWEDGRVNPNGDDDIYISQIADPPTAIANFINVNGKCQNAASARGKLLNPPVTADVIITLDGNPLIYFPADSSFEYFTAGTATPGNHTVRVRYSNFAGFTQKDSVYTVTAPLVPTITISGNTTVNQGQSTTLSSGITVGGPGPLFQWEDSTTGLGWTIIPGATNPTLVYTPSQSSNKIRCFLTSNASCVTQASTTSNVLVFTVNTVTAINPVPSSLYGIRYYPNPSRELITVDSLKLSDRWSSLDVFSMDGKKLMPSKNITGLLAVSINITRLPAAGYIMVLRRKQGAAAFLKFIKY